MIATLAPLPPAGPTVADVSLANALGYRAGHVFGEPWRNDPDYVLACLAHYCDNEGHGKAIGRPVRWLAEVLAYWQPNEGTGEQHSALACLLLAGRGDRLIPQPAAHYLGRYW